MSEKSIYRKRRSLWPGVKILDRYIIGKFLGHVYLRHSDDYRGRGRVRLRRETRQLHRDARAGVGNHIRLLSQLRAVLRQSVQRAVHLHRRDILHLEDGVPDRNRRHAVGRNEFPAADVALFHRRVRHHGSVVRAEHVADTRFAARLRGVRVEVHQDPQGRPVRTPYLPPDRTRDVRLRAQLQQDVAVGDVLRP